MAANDNLNDDYYNSYISNGYIAIDKRLYFERVYSNGYISNGYFKQSYPNGYISNVSVFHLYIYRLIHPILRRANHFIIASSPENE